MNSSNRSPETLYLGVNVDHVATIRQARGTSYPSVVHAALAAEQAGADSITAHLREDRRHIQDRDIDALKDLLQTRLNLEMAVTEEMIAIACRVRPHAVCLVPERREELTTEGGLDVKGNIPAVSKACQRLAAAGIQVSLFIDAQPEQIDAAHRAGAPAIELHTGHYADAADENARDESVRRVRQAAGEAAARGLRVHAGHGLHYHNVQAICRIGPIVELNIGHAIIARALFAGIGPAVREMRLLMDTNRRNVFDPTA
jgi:pyridoxine 5-phosphate synthase